MARTPVTQFDWVQPVADALQMKLRIDGTTVKGECNRQLAIPGIPTTCRLQIKDGWIEELEGILNLTMRVKGMVYAFLTYCDGVMELWLFDRNHFHTNRMADELGSWLTVDEIKALLRPALIERFAKQDGGEWESWRDSDSKTDKATGAGDAPPVVERQSTNAA